MTSRDYPPQPAGQASLDDDASTEPLDRATLRDRIAAREAANERFRKLKQKLLAARAADEERR